MSQDKYAPQANDDPYKVNKLHLDLIKQQQEENRKARQGPSKKVPIAPSDVTVPGPFPAPAPGGHIAPPISKQVAEHLAAKKPAAEQPPTQPPESSPPQNPQAEANQPSEQK